MPKIKQIFVLVFSTIFLTNCGEEASAPKPWGFHRIEMPKLEGYKTFDNGTCPFTFEYPSYGEVSRNQQDSCWVDIAFPYFNCKWHISHQAINDKKDRIALFEEFRKLVYKHSKKVSTITDTPIETQVAKGVKYELYGNIATPIELFLYNDKHTMTLDFYYNTALHNDSLAPITEQMKKDIAHLVESVKWKD